MTQEDGQVFQRHFLRNGLPPVAIAYRYGVNGKQLEARERTGDVKRAAANLPSAVARGDIATALRQRIEMENYVAKSGADHHDRRGDSWSALIVTAVPLFWSEDKIKHQAQNKRDE